MYTNFVLDYPLHLPRATTTMLLKTVNSATKYIQTRMGKKVFNRWQI